MDVGIRGDLLRAVMLIEKVARALALKKIAFERVIVSEPHEIALIDDEPVLVLDLARRVKVPPVSEPEDVALLVLTELRGERVALRVDRFVGQQEIYVKSIPRLLTRVRLLAGMTVLEDGSPVFLLDLNHLA